MWYIDPMPTENILRPSGFDEYIGQSNIKNHLKIILGAAKVRGEVPAHLLFTGPPGLGKTSLANVVATELGSKMHDLFAPTMKKGEDLAKVLVQLEEGDVLFIDEIHALGRAVEEVLYAAMEDFHIDLLIDDKPIRIQLPRFTMVGATTLPGRLTGPLRDRFGFTGRLDYYTPQELSQVIQQSAKKLGIDINIEAAELIGSRSRGTPRIANRLLQRARDFAQCMGPSHANYQITTTLAEAALSLFGVDEMGLEDTDREILAALVGQFRGQPVGLATLAATVGQDENTIETMVEPFLLRQGLIVKTPRGRQAAPAAYTHLGLRVPIAAM